MMSISLARSAKQIMLKCWTWEARQPSQEVVNLVTQNTAPAKAKEEFATDEGKPPA
jgi:hypothetical protein